MSLRRVLVVPCVLAVVALAACSSSSKAPSPAADASAKAGAPAAAASTPADSSKPIPHPCTLLTPQDGEAVLGAGATVKRNSEDSCILETQNALGPVVEVKIEAAPDTWDGGEMMMKFDKTAKKVEGLGDGAYTYSGGSIVFKKGAAQVSVLTTAYKGAMSKFDAARLIAERVAAKM